MKKYIYLILLLCIGVLSKAGITHANTDYVRTNTITYSCDSTNGIGTLRIEFGGGGTTVLHHRDMRYYHINHAGWVTITNGDARLATGNIPTGAFYIPGCTRLDACTTINELRTPTNYSPVAGNQLKYRYETNILDGCNHNYTYPANFPNTSYNVTISGNSLNYWPINSGPSDRDWSWGIVKNVTIRGSERNDRGRWVCNNNQGTATARYATTVVTLIPGPNGGLPDTRSTLYYNHLNQERLLVALNPYTGMQFGTGDIFVSKPPALQLSTLRTALATTPTSICQVRTSCDPTVANTVLRTTTLDATGARCSVGTPTNFVATTDATGKTIYSWSCSHASAESVSCNAYYKPLCVPSATNGCCDERKIANDPTNTTQFGHAPRLPEQCQYSVIMSQPTIGMTGGIMQTQSGSTVVALTGSYLRSTNGIAGSCQAPVDGKPRIVCDAVPSVNITGTFSAFTLPSSITQRVGSCRVIFDAPDVCRPREDTIQTRAVVANCDPTIIDENNPQYCPREITSVDVCLALTDRFGNPIYEYATNRIVKVLDRVELNEYYSRYNDGQSDPTVYKEGTFSVVSNNYCAKICTIVNGNLCGEGCPDQASATCSPPPPVVTIGDPIDVCVPTAANNNCTPPSPTGIPGCTDTAPGACTLSPCSPTIANNFCNPPIPVTIPGCDLPGYTGDPMLCIQREKACTAHLEVLDTMGNWTVEGDTIVYDETMAYRIIVDGADPVCRNGYVTVDSVTATGGIFSGSISWSSTGTFTATVIRNNSTIPTTARGPVVSAVYTQPGGISYGLTARADDFEDTPLTITGERMKGVRIIGAAGTSITSFNLNNAGVIGEDSSSNTVTMRNAILKNVGLLTRSVTPNDSRSINGVYYAEGDYTYSQLSGMTSNGFRTVILRGNLTIDTSFPGHTSTTPIIGVIVVKRSDGSKGNIIINNDVTSMRGVLFAEGSLYGETQTFGNVPLTKLLLKGTLFSRNTIGGSADINNLYISGGSTTTDIPLAFLQDLNNVRNGYGCPLGGPQCYKNYPDPFIIEYENTQSDPPPGFSL